MAKIFDNNILISGRGNDFTNQPHKGHGNTLYLIEIINYPLMINKQWNFLIALRQGKKVIESRRRWVEYRSRVHTSNVTCRIFVVKPRKKKVVEICKRHGHKKVFALRGYVKKEATVIID